MVAEQVRLPSVYSCLVDVDAESSVVSAVRQDLVQYYQQNSLEPSFPEVPSVLLIPYKDAAARHTGAFCLLHLYCAPPNVHLSFSL